MGGGGGLLCANNKPSTPRYSPPRKPAHPTDWHHKAAIFWGGAFVFFAVRHAPFEPQQSSRSNQQNNKNDPLFLILFDATIIEYYYYPLNYVLKVSSVLLCLVALHGD